MVLLLLVLLYGITIPADSGAWTYGMSQSAVPAQRGATMALHTTVGFGLSAAGAWAVGVALDAAGGPASPTAWGGVRGSRHSQPARSAGPVGGLDVVSTGASD
jgi:hypothetical protein